MAKKAAKENDVNNDVDDEDEGPPVRKAPAGHDERMTKALDAAINKVGDGPPAHKDFSFGAKHVGFGHDLKMTPVVKEFAANLGVKPNAKGFPKLIDLLDLWQPTQPAYVLLKKILVVTINSLTNRMAAKQVDDLDDDGFLTDTSPVE